jgi:hypothetical protein
MILYYVKEISSVFKIGGAPVTRNTIGSILKLGNSYEGDLTPTMINPNTYLPAPPSYVIKCDDGMFRKFDAEFFITEQEWKQMNRENKLKEIGI